MEEAEETINEDGRMNGGENRHEWRKIRDLLSYLKMPK